MNPEVWQQPTQFDPSRFVLPEETDDPYAFLSFIQGPRNCLGQHLALLEARIVLGLLAKVGRFCSLCGLLSRPPPTR